jgi:hypothetical protein
VAAFIVGLPACFFETIICGPPILRAGPKHSMTRFCAGVGAALGIFFYALVSGTAESIRVGSPPPTTDSRTITWVIFVTVGVSGMISGGIFAVLAGASVPPKVSPVGDLDDIQRDHRREPDVN